MECNMCKMLTFILLAVSVLKSHAASFNCTQPPNFSNFDVNSCCRTPELNLGSIPEKCDKYVNAMRTDKAENYPPYAHVCYPDCIYRETGALVNGEIEFSSVQQFLQNNVSERDRDIVPQIIKSFETCLQNINGHMQSVGIKMYAALPEGCTPYASMVFGCVNAETYLHCPAKMWKNERNCNLAKSFAQQCNPLPHVPLPMV